MSTIAPPSSPLLTVPAPEPDDIPEPPVPPAVLEAATAPPVVPPLPEALLPLAHGFCQYLQSRMHTWLMDEHRQLTQGMDVTMSGIRDYALKVLQCNEHAEYQLAEALRLLREDGLKVSSAPYAMQLQVRTPAGIPLTLTIQQTTPSALLEELTRLEAWLAVNHYVAGDAVGVG